MVARDTTGALRVIPLETCHCLKCQRYAIRVTWQEARDAIQHDPACPEYRERKNGEA